MPRCIIVVPVTLQPASQTGHDRRLIILTSVLVTGGFVAGITLGGVLWYSPPPPTSAKAVWPLHISADFASAPANTTLIFTLSIVKDNRTLGTADFTIPYPSDGTGLVAFVLSQTLDAVTQTVQVIFRVQPYGIYGFIIEVAPGSPYATPLPYFHIAYGYPQSSPIHLDGWGVDLQEVG